MESSALEGFRRKEPVGKLMDESFAALDHVLGYLTLKDMLSDEMEAQILSTFDKLTTIKEQLKNIVPADDY